MPSFSGVWGAPQKGHWAHIPWRLVSGGKKAYVPSGSILCLPHTLFTSQTLSDLQYCMLVMASLLTKVVSGMI